MKNYIYIFKLNKYLLDYDIIHKVINYITQYSDFIFVSVTC